MKIFLHSVNLGVNLKHTIKFINPTKYIYGGYTIVYSLSRMYIFNYGCYPCDTCVYGSCV